jgi:hypothetical protein
MFIIAILYGFVSDWSASMLSYFFGDLVSDKDKLGFNYSMISFANIWGVRFGQFFFLKIQYRFSVIIALVLEILGIFIFMFLTPSSSYDLIALMFLLGGLVTSVSDAVYRTMQIDAANLTETPTFLYSWLLSLLNVPELISGVAAPQAKRTKHGLAFGVLV